MRNQEFQTKIDGCPCIAVVVANVPAIGIRGRFPDDDVIDAGGFEVELHWLRGGRARALEAKMSDRDFERIRDEANGY